MHSRCLSKTVKTEPSVYPKHNTADSSIQRIHNDNEKWREKYQLIKEIILEFGFRIYLLRHLEIQLIK
jgi:hypothetical protein